jgi:AcrR family transcriptional regulator
LTRPLRYLDDAEVADAERAAFIAAAFELLADSDRIHLSVGDVVARSGRHRAAFYRLFGSRDGLILAMAQSAVQRTVAHLGTRMAAAESDAGSVRVWATYLLELAVPRPETRGVRALALDRFRLLQQFTSAEQLLVQPIVELLTPFVRLAHCRPDVVAQSACDIVMGRQSSWMAAGHRPTSAEVSGYVEVVLALTGHPQPAADG